MPQAPATKPYHQLNLGINTERNELTYDEGFTTDECNFELLVDGSRRRRKGLQQESGGSSKVVSDLAEADTGAFCGAYLWKNVGGDPDKRFWVHKISNKLYFTPDSDTPSANWHDLFIDLDSFAFQDSMDDEAIDFSDGKGVLFIAGKFIKPIYITYDATNDEFTATEINLRVRDYTTIEDSLLTGEQPTTLTADHEYNLLNRGWRGDDIDDYETGQGAYPSRSQVWHKGYKRVNITGAADEDGTWTFDDGKMAAHPFANASAPVGSLYIPVFNDTIGNFEVNPDGSASTVTDSTPTITGSGPLTIELDETSHSFTTSDDVQFVAGRLLYEVSTGDAFNSIDIGGTTQTVTDDDPNSDGDAWQFVLNVPSDYGTFVRWVEDPQWIATGIIERSSGTGPLDVGPKAIEFHQGRVFYAGIPDGTWSTYVFYSQIAVDDTKYNKCHTENDPTDMFLSQSVATDGGYIQLPDIGNVIKMLSYRDSILIFSDEGVWEISGGRAGVISPDTIVPRKITSAECDSPNSPIVVDGTVFYTGPKGIYAIAPNQYTNVLEAQNISDERIRTLWNNITPTFRPRVATAYDDANKRLYFFHGGDENTEGYDLIGESFSSSNERRHYNVALILDLRIGGWFKYAWQSTFKEGSVNGLLYAFAISGEDTSDTAKKLKFVWMTQANTVQICDLDSDDYEDIYSTDGFGTPTESPIPYMFTAHDNIGDWQRRKQAPIVTVYNKRTTTSYNDTGSGWDAINPSSVKLTAFWDWTNDAVTGKDYGPIQTYREQRMFIPASASDVDGYPVVVTRNKIRGRGRALQLLFTGEAEYDSHILGFDINYKVSKRI